MQLGAFIITFNRPEILKQTLQLILGQTRPPDFILIVDNGRAKDTEIILRDFDHHRLLHHPMGDNLGPATAEAYGLQWLSEQGYDWIYWVDDDDPPRTPDTLEHLLDVVTRQGQQPDVMGVAAAGQLFNWATGEVQRLPDEALNGVISVDVIGGNQPFLLKREVIQAVGLPDTRLFIDFEETEYCLRIRKAGYRLLVDGDLMRVYRAKAGRLNLRQSHWPLLQRNYNSLWRRYYSTRNYIFAMNNTFQRPDLAQREALKSFGRALLSWRRGPKYGTAFTSLQLRGVLDGYLGRMGRTVSPRPKSASSMERYSHKRQRR